MLRSIEDVWSKNLNQASIVLKRLAAPDDT